MLDQLLDNLESIRIGALRGEDTIRPVLTKAREELSRLDAKRDALSAALYDAERAFIAGVPHGEAVADRA